jgi:hypothetical protein
MDRTILDRTILDGPLVVHRQLEWKHLGRSLVEWPILERQLVEWQLVERSQLVRRQLAIIPT